jgi:hypothetical protein
MSIGMRYNVKFVVLILMALVTSPAFGGGSDGAPRNVLCGSIRLEVSNIVNEEERDVGVSIYSNRKKIFPDLSWAGSFMSLCKQERYLLIDANELHIPGDSFLMNTDSKVVARLSLGEVFTYGKTLDEKIFWVQSKRYTAHAYTTVLDVYDYQGVRLLKKEYTSSTYKGGMRESVDYQGTAYTIRIEKPNADLTPLNKLGAYSN